MKSHSTKGRILIGIGDIADLPTAWRVDGLVNAANGSLLGGGGVDGSIHRAAGPQLLAFTRTLGGCETGGVKHSPAFDLEHVGVRHLFHAVGPVWLGDEIPDAGRGERVEEDDELASCYRQSLALAREKGVKRLAFPAISTGVYRFPKRRAAKIALEEVHRHLKESPVPEQVFFVFFARANAEIFWRVAQTRPEWSESVRWME